MDGPINDEGKDGRGYCEIVMRDKATEGSFCYHIMTSGEKKTHHHGKGQPRQRRSPLELPVCGLTKEIPTCSAYVTQRLFLPVTGRTEKGGKPPDRHLRIKPGI